MQLEVTREQAETILIALENRIDKCESYIQKAPDNAHWKEELKQAKEALKAVEDAGVFL